MIDIQNHIARCRHHPGILLYLTTGKRTGNQRTGQRGYQQIIFDREIKLQIRPSQFPNLPVRVLEPFHPYFIIFNEREQPRFKEANHVQFTQITNIQEIVIIQRHLMTGYGHGTIRHDTLHLRVTIRQRIYIL